jgi:hypothetical protein
MKPVYPIEGSRSDAEAVNDERKRCLENIIRKYEKKQKSLNKRNHPAKP